MWLEKRRILEPCRVRRDSVLEKRRILEPFRVRRDSVAREKAYFRTI